MFKGCPRLYQRSREEEAKRGPMSAGTAEVKTQPKAKGGKKTGETDILRDTQTGMSGPAQSIKKHSKARVNGQAC